MTTQYAYYFCSLVTSPLPGSDSRELTDLKLNCSYLVLYSELPHEENIHLEITFLSQLVQNSLTRLRFLADQ